MGFFSRLKTTLLTVQACRCFAQDPCFEKIRNSFDSVGFKWQEELVQKLKTYDSDKLIYLIMDKAFFLPDRFEILIDARGFRPEDIRCMLTAKSLEVSAQKEDRFDNNAQKRMSLTRQYVLPQNAVPEKGQCCLSSDGMLLVTAPWLR